MIDELLPVRDRKCIGMQMRVCEVKSGWVACWTNDLGSV